MRHTHSQTVGRQLSFTDIFLVVSHYFPKSIALYPNLLMVKSPVCKCVYIICIYMILFYKYISYVHIYIYIFVHTRHIHNMCIYIHMYVYIYISCIYTITYWSFWFAFWGSAGILSGKHIRCGTTSGSTVDGLRGRNHRLRSLANWDNMQIPTSLKTRDHWIEENIFIRFQKINKRYPLVN